MKSKSHLFQVEFPRYNYFPAGFLIKRLEYDLIGKTIRFNILEDQKFSSMKFIHVLLHTSDNIECERILYDSQGNELQTIIFKGLVFKSWYNILDWENKNVVCYDLAGTFDSYDTNTK